MDSLTPQYFTHAALYGTLFQNHKEAAFANYRMWESLGFVIAFAYSTFICLSTKLYILIAVLVLNMVTYLWVEYNEYKHPTAVKAIDNIIEEKNFDIINEKSFKEMPEMKQMNAQTRM